jgi:hypothetical protein
MPIRYERDDDRRRVVITMDGPFEPADFLAVIERWRGEDVGAYGMLYDLRGMTGVPSVADLRQFMSEAARTTRPRGPLAILATDPVIYGRACTYATLGRANADNRGVSRPGQSRAVADGSGEGDGERRGVMPWDDDLEQLSQRRRWGQAFNGMGINAATALAYFRTLGELDLTECMR